VVREWKGQQGIHRSLIASLWRDISQVQLDLLKGKHVDQWPEIEKEIAGAFRTVALPCSSHRDLLLGRGV
jgi:hypothetical protein